MYSKQFDQKRYEPISRAVGQIEKLSPGGKVTIENLTREQMVRVRYLLYDWMSHLGVKQSYRIRTDYSTKQITVTHLGAYENMDVSISQGSKYLEPFVEQLIGLENPEEQIRLWITEKKLNVEQGAEILRSLKEVMA